MLEAWSNRRGFWTQATAMVVNDLVWITFWLMFFRQVGEIRGWGQSEVLVLLAVLTTAGGIVLGILHNVRRLGQMVSNGELDAALALPVRPLPLILVRRVDPVNIGDIVFGLVLFFAFCDPTPQRTLLFGFGVVCATLVMTGFLILMGSLSFFVGRNESGELGFHAILLFAAYPVDVFGGVTKVLLYTVVPAGFVSGAPARLIREFDLTWALVTFGVSVLAMLIGWVAFERGLRRYTSGAVWIPA